MSSSMLNVYAVYVVMKSYASRNAQNSIFLYFQTSELNHRAR